MILEQFERVVGTIRIMMEEYEATCVNGPAEVDRGFDARMAPTDPRLVLIFGVLSVVQYEVGSMGKSTA